MNKWNLSFLLSCFILVLSPIVSAKADRVSSLNFTQSVNETDFETAKKYFQNNSIELTSKLKEISILDTEFDDHIEHLNSLVQQYNLDIAKSIQARDDLKKQQTILKADLARKESQKNGLSRDVNRISDDLRRLVENSSDCLSGMGPISFIAKKFCEAFKIKRAGFERDLSRKKEEYIRAVSEYDEAEIQVSEADSKVKNMDANTFDNEEVLKNTELRMKSAKTKIHDLNSSSMRFLELGETFKLLNMEMETSKYNDDPSVLFQIFLDCNLKYEANKESISFLIEQYKLAINQELKKPILSLRGQAESL